MPTTCDVLKAYVASTEVIQWTLENQGPKTPVFYLYCLGETAFHTGNLADTRELELPYPVVSKLRHAAAYLNRAYHLMRVAAPDPDGRMLDAMDDIDRAMAKMGEAQHLLELGAYCRSNTAR